jgi:transposase
MEATGVYWLPLYEILEAAGLAVVVVNGRHVKNLPGRKTDMQDCQWLATLHAHGLLRGGFVPGAAIRRLRDYQRLRQDHLAMGATHIQHMQKALERMNVKVHDVLSQLTGQSGLRVVRAILAGERDPEKLADLCDAQVLLKKRDRLIQSLRGTWNPEHVFALKQALAGWNSTRPKFRNAMGNWPQNWINSPVRNRLAPQRRPIHPPNTPTAMPPKSPTCTRCWSGSSAGRI